MLGQVWNHFPTSTHLKHTTKVSLPWSIHSPNLIMENLMACPLIPLWIGIFKSIVHDQLFLNDSQHLAYLQNSVTGATQSEIQFLDDGVNYIISSQKDCACSHCCP